MVNICAPRFLFQIPFEARILESFSASETLSSVAIRAGLGPAHIEKS